MVPSSVVGWLLVRPSAMGESVSPNGRTPTHILNLQYYQDL